jgi:hypothetical protein
MFLITSMGDANNIITFNKEACSIDNQFTLTQMILLKTTWRQCGKRFTLMQSQIRLKNRFLHPAEMEIGKWRAETGAPKPAPHERLGRANLTRGNVGDSTHRENNTPALPGHLSKALTR